MTRRRMDRAALEGFELEYEIRGAGEPVVLIHPGNFADWFTPLLDEPALTGHYRALTYHRAGCAGSSRIAGPISLAQQAAHCRSLMRHLGIERAHVVGHSSSGNIALQLALDPRTPCSPSGSWNRRCIPCRVPTRHERS
jgi:pimeloyl-ACP methyl ester carboxylesterase